MQDKIKQLLTDIQRGNHKALARGITIVENELDGYEDLLRTLSYTSSNKIIGITGPPGAGKSTLVNVLLRYWITQGKKIAVIAVDPSSPFNYGALLGDRIRMSEFYNNDHVFIRSLASRGALGGLTSKILEITDLVKSAPFDLILVETVGVGQSEVEIAGLADCTVVTLVPEAGDEVQTIKAGIMEIADIFVVNKADRSGAETLYRSLKMLVHEQSKSDHETAVIKTIATENVGIEELANAIDKFISSNRIMTDGKLNLLTEKIWHLLVAKRMKNFKRSIIRTELLTALNKNSFNIYSLVDKLVESGNPTT